MKIDVKMELKGSLSEVSTRLATFALGSKFRKGGQCALDHALHVTAIVQDEFHILDDETLALSRLHDVLEDGGVSESDLYRWIPASVVKDVVVLTKPAIRKKKLRKEAHINAICSGSDRAKLVKLSDLISNLRSRRCSPREEKTRRGARAFLAMLLEQPQSSDVWTGVKVLIRELRIHGHLFFGEAGFPTGPCGLKEMPKVTPEAAAA